jgi:hypothetical protein
MSSLGKSDKSVTALEDNENHLSHQNVLFKCAWPQLASGHSRLLPASEALVFCARG